MCNSRLKRISASRLLPLGCITVKIYFWNEDTAHKETTCHVCSSPRQSGKLPSTWFQPPRASQFPVLCIVCHLDARRKEEVEEVGSCLESISASAIWKRHLYTDTPATRREKNNLPARSRTSFLRRWPVLVLCFFFVFRYIPVVLR